jgi:hypothetical protein
VRAYRVAVGQLVNEPPPDLLRTLIRRSVLLPTATSPLSDLAPDSESLEDDATSARPRESSSDVRCQDTCPSAALAFLIVARRHVSLTELFNPTRIEHAGVYRQQSPKLGE